jgi:hypothetical protein
MQIDTAALKRILEEELGKREAEKNRIERQLEELERRQRTLRLNLEFVSSVEGLAFLFDTILATGDEDPAVYQAAPRGPAPKTETLDLSTVVEETKSASSLLQRLMKDELRNFRPLRKKS